jgi:hypothetical protein
VEFLAAVTSPIDLVKVSQAGIVTVRNEDWIGDAEAATIYSMYFRELQGQHLNADPIIHRLSVVNRAFAETVNSLNARTVGGFVIRSQLTGDGFRYLPSSEQYSPTISATGASVFSPAVGGFAYSVLTPAEPGIPIVGVHILQGQIGFVYAPLSQDQPHVMTSALLLPGLVESMAAGLLVDAGLHPLPSLRSASPHAINLEYSFSDGRGDFCQRVVRLVDDSRSLSGSVTDLRDLANHVLGGEPIRVRVPGEGCDVEIWNTRGHVRGWVAERVPERISANPLRLLASRGRQLANWGLQTTGRMLRYLNAVRHGEATTEDRERLEASLRGDLEFWRKSIGEMQIASQQIGQMVSQTAPRK